MQSNYKKSVCALTCAAFLTLAAGCSDEQRQPTAASSVESQSDKDVPECCRPKEPKALKVNVYYPKDDGMGLVAVTRTVNTEKDDKYTAAMKSLLTGTKEKGQTTVIPKKAKLHSAERHGDRRFFEGAAAKLQRRIDGRGDACRIDCRYADGVPGGSERADPDRRSQSGDSFGAYGSVRTSRTDVRIGEISRLVILTVL